jgi:O-antigen ligase
VPVTARLLVFYLTAVVAAFGGIYPWALAPILIGSTLVALLSPWRRSWMESDTRSLDIAIGVLLAAVAVQLVPLPAGLRTLLSPHAADVERTLRPDAALRDMHAGPLSVSPSDTLEALALMLAVALTYWGARRTFHIGGVRFVCQALSMVGAVMAMGAIVQRVWSPQRIYGFWQPLDTGAVPFGPVVNRNHFAAWLLMTSALTAGFLLARILKRLDRGRGWRAAVMGMVPMAQSPVMTTFAFWLITTLTLFVSQSRSAIVGLVVSAVTLHRSVAGSWRPVAAASVLFLTGVTVLLLSGEATTAHVADRFAGTLANREIDRVDIWRETLPMLMDFGLTGVGAGAFTEAMLAYQETYVFVPHLQAAWQFNHAHNHYLHVATEGGLLVTMPVVAVVVLFVRVAIRRVRNGDGEMRAVRLGAVAGLLGVAVQSLWEVPLTMPAAALLAATLAALATYRRAPVDRLSRPSFAASRTMRQSMHVEPR